MKKFLLCSISAIALGVATSDSAVLYSQSFESLTNGDLNGQSGFTALPQADVATGGLSYSAGTVSVPGGTKDVSITGLAPANNWVLSNTFTAPTGTVYFSLAMTWTGQQIDDFLYFALSDSVRTTTPVALGNSGGIVINGFGGATPGMIGGRIRNDSSANTTQTASAFGGGSATSSTQFLVGSLSKVSSTNYNTLNIWVNPTTTTQGASNLTITRDMGLSSGLDTFFFFSGSTNEAIETIRLDNITIGDNYADVIGAVPEPSVGLLVLGGLGMLLVGQRSRKNRLS